MIGSVASRCLEMVASAPSAQVSLQKPTPDFCGSVNDPRCYLVGQRRGRRRPSLRELFRAVAIPEEGHYIPAVTQEGLLTMLLGEGGVSTSSRTVTRSAVLPSPHPQPERRLRFRQVSQVRRRVGQLLHDRGVATDVLGSEALNDDMTMFLRPLPGTARSQGLPQLCRCAGSR